MRTSWFVLEAATWREDLLWIALRFMGVLGGLVYLPSVYFALVNGKPLVVAVDSVALTGLLALIFVRSIPSRLRATFGCLLLYALGAMLLTEVGPVSQIYLFAFSIFATLLVGHRWGLLAVALNVTTFLVLGLTGLASPRLGLDGSPPGLGEWLLIISNFALVDVGVVLLLGAVLEALDSALARGVRHHDAVEPNRRELQRLNHSMGEEARGRARSEESLRLSQELLRVAELTARLGGWRFEPATRAVVWSDEVCDLHEVPPGTSPSVEDAICFFLPESRTALEVAVTACARDGTPFDLEGQIKTASGTTVWVRKIGHALRDAKGAIIHVHGSIQDISPQKAAEARNDRLEEQFRQAQKLDTVGSLAGGIAHDFNNLMSIVLSYSDLLAEDLLPDSPLRADLNEIRNAGQRATVLTRQLLAFSRQQVLEPRVVALPDTIKGMENMLRRLLGEDVELVTLAGEGSCKVLIDPGQLEQVVMNLAVNARDAMPTGGTLTLETACVVLDAAFVAEHVGVVAGPHVRLTVGDTGTGMSLATQARMFEPFFTTKEAGKGTGLGLATVFGIIKQSGGAIWVDSAPGRGTTFILHFPLAAGEASALEVTTASDQRAAGGDETILLVEDESSLREVARTILRKRGYTVLEAQNGGEALLICEQHPGAIHLLLSDVVMPRMSGRQLADRLLPMRPQMRVLFMSGYTDDAVVRHGVLSATLSFLQKPIRPGPLARKVREVLDAKI